MASKGSGFSKRTRRIGYAAFILILFVLGASILTKRLVSQLYYQGGVNRLRDGYYLLAVRKFENAVALQPNYSAAWRELGRARGNLADLYPVKEAFPLALKAKLACLKAVALSPLDCQSAFGLAMAEARLESLYPRVHVGRTNNPYDPLGYFEQAIGLRPNSMSYRYSLARYLYRKGEKEALKNAVRVLARIYPSVYNRLRQESFWSNDIAQEFKGGIVQAIREGNGSKDAHLVLARILEQEKDWPGALVHFQKAMTFETGPDWQRENFKHLGRLFLKNHQPEKAEDAFLEALYRSDTPAGDLAGFFREFEKAGFAGQLPRFYGKVKARFSVSERMDILLAKTLIRSGMLKQARKILGQKNLRESSPEAWYLLARIAEKEKDPAAMQDAMGRATALDPRNSGFHLLFSKVLARRGKLVWAEKEAGLAIRHAQKPLARLFIHRAGIRLRRGDYGGAARDLESAVSLDPQNPGLCMRAAKAFERAGDLSKAAWYFKRAASLRPGDKGHGQAPGPFQEPYSR